MALACWLLWATDGDKAASDTPVRVTPTKAVTSIWSNTRRRFFGRMGALATVGFGFASFPEAWSRSGSGMVVLRVLDKGGGGKGLLHGAAGIVRPASSGDSGLCR